MALGSWTSFKSSFSLSHTHTHTQRVIALHITLHIRVTRGSGEAAS